MKVGTDGVLLGAWTSIPGIQSGVRCLDIGTGTGIISLMLAQRLSDADPEFHVSALEIDPEAAAQAAENFDASPWGGHITTIPSSLQDFAQNEENRYSLIVSNPPFYNATLKPEDTSRALARHKDALPVIEITRFASSHLCEEGRLSLIYPADYDSEVMTAAIISGLQPVRICDILTKEGKPCKRRMAEFALSSSSHPELTREQLSIRDTLGNYTLQYRQLTDNFYLHLA